jgi:hypothetical protein
MMGQRPTAGNPQPDCAALLAGAQPIGGLILESPIPLIHRNMQWKTQISAVRGPDPSPQLIALTWNSENFAARKTAEFIPLKAAKQRKISAERGNLIPAVISRRSSGRKSCLDVQTGRSA